VSVIGWAWILLGGFAAFAAGFVMLALGAIAELRFESATLLIMAVAAVEFALGAVGVVAGVAFLRLVPWSRSTLEVLAWLMLAALASTLGCVIVGDPLGDGPVERVGATVVTALLYGAPLALMLHGLRSEKVRLALGVPAQQAHQPDSRSLD
jgi:hypothetical protein